MFGLCQRCAFSQCLKFHDLCRNIQAQNKAQLLRGKLNPTVCSLSGLELCCTTSAALKPSLFPAVNTGPRVGLMMMGASCQLEREVKLTRTSIGSVLSIPGTC